MGVIVLYDYIHPGGAFAETSKVDMKGCFKVPKDQSSNCVEGLLSAPRYTTKHLSDETTSMEIRSLLQMEQGSSIVSLLLASSVNFYLDVPKV